MKMMMETIIEILKTYWYMFWYFILKLPYVLKILFEYLFVCLFLFFIFKVIFLMLRYVIIPLITLLTQLLIKVLQIILDLISKFNIRIRKTLVPIDRGLNYIGLCLESFKNKFRDTKRLYLSKNRIRGIIIVAGLLVISIIVVPYYIKGYVGGKALDTCLKIEQFVRSAESTIFKDIDDYYVATDEAKIETDVSFSDTMETEPVITLHLSKEGKHGANLRSSPGKRFDNILETVSGDDIFYYLNEIVRKDNISWLKVRTSKYDEAWISAWMIEEKME